MTSTPTIMMTAAKTATTNPTRTTKTVNIYNTDAKEDTFVFKNQKKTKTKTTTTKILNKQ